MIILDPFKKKHLSIAIKMLLEGNLVAFPTETVYGVGCVCNNLKAYEKLNILKKREKDKPYTIMLSKVSDIKKYAIIKDKKIKKFLYKIFPGPITVVLPAKKKLPFYLKHNDSVGIRIPDCEVILNMINGLKNGLLAPSLNISGEKPLNNIFDIKKNFGNLLSAVIKPNKIIGGTASTVMTFENNEIKLLREGKISLEYLNNIYDKIKV